MNKFTVLVAAVAILAGIVIGCAFKCCGKKMAVVDVAAVVSKSAQVQVLKNDLENKTRELTQWLANVQEEVKSEENKEKQDELLQKYNAEFAQKREEISKDYNAKLQAVDKDINDTIAKTAKDKGYKCVLSKASVVYGGDDITEDILKVVK